MWNGGRYDLHALPGCFLDLLCDFGLNTWRHVVEVVEQQDVAAVRNLPNYLRQSVPRTRFAASSGTRSSYCHRAFGCDGAEEGDSGTALRSAARGAGDG